MQHPTEPLAALDATKGWRCRRQRTDQAIVAPLVIPFVVVVRDALADAATPRRRDAATPRALADRDQALEAGFLDGAHEALRVGVQVRRAGGESDGGDIGRHRLNRGGHRQANVALYRAVIVRMRFHQPTVDYVARRTAGGRTKRDIIRCLKRFLARESYQRVMTDYRARQADIQAA